MNNDFILIRNEGVNFFDKIVFVMVFKINFVLVILIRKLYLLFVSSNIFFVNDSLSELVVVVNMNIFWNKKYIYMIYICFLLKFIIVF